MLGKVRARAGHRFMAAQPVPGPVTWFVGRLFWARPARPAGARQTRAYTTVCAGSIVLTEWYGLGQLFGHGLSRMRCR